MTYWQPAMAVFLLLIAGGLLRHESRVWRRWGWAGFAGLFLWSWPPVAWLFSGSLEWQYPSRIVPSDEAGAIVVLAADVLPPDGPSTEPQPGLSTYLRCRHAAWLYATWRQVPVLVSGGPVTSGYIAARRMRRELEAAGVPGDRIWTEEESRSTFENAKYSADQLRRRGIVRVALVTEAYHMPRSVRAFRKQGLDVVPAPCCYRSTALRGPWFLPGAGPMRANGDNLHEWIGLAWYRLSGKL
jgi:uncharacterized SAM-binding protein YcdF (DUF218 family)